MDWDEKADGTVAGLRTEAGRDPHDAALSELVDELTVASDAFRARWAADDVRIHSTGVTRFRHPLAGEMTLTFEALALTADSGLTVIAYTAEAGSASRAALDRLTDEAAAL